MTYLMFYVKKSWKIDLLLLKDLVRNASRVDSMYSKKTMKAHDPIGLLTGMKKAVQKVPILVPFVSKASQGNSCVIISTSEFPLRPYYSCPGLKDH